MGLLDNCFIAYSTSWIRPSGGNICNWSFFKTLSKSVGRFSLHDSAPISYFFFSLGSFIYSCLISDLRFVPYIISKRYFRIWRWQKCSFFLTTGTQFWCLTPRLKRINWICWAYYWILNLHYTGGQKKKCHSTNERQHKRRTNGRNFGILNGQNETSCASWSICQRSTHFDEVGDKGKGENNLVATGFEQVTLEFDCYRI